MQLFVLRPATLLVATLGLLASSCAGKQREAAAPAPEPPPDWVTRGTCLVGEPGQEKILAVGQANGINNAAEARSAADNRARYAATQIIEALLEALERQYVAATAGPDTPPEELGVERACKGTFCGPWRIAGIEIAERHIGSGLPGEEGAWLSLATWELRHLVEALPTIREWSDEMKQWVRLNAGRVLRELMAEPPAPE